VGVERTQGYGTHYMFCSTGSGGKGRLQKGKKTNNNNVEEKLRERERLFQRKDKQKNCRFKREGPQTKLRPGGGCGGFWENPQSGGRLF